MYKFILSLIVSLLSFQAQAYDLDTHFYGTYSMARFSGIRHEVALKIATGAQWMDESYISDPLSMILLPDVGIKKRRLLHFPGSRLANKLTVNSLPKYLLFDPSSKAKLKMFTETEAEHPFATEMFTEGLMQGDLMKASVGLHTLEDSFSHAGTIAELGHAHFWHHPDRPYVNEQSVEKYFKMCRAVLKAMVAIRSLLPMSAIDTTVQFSDVANYQLNGDRLADIYIELPQVKKTVSHKILNDQTFVRFALNHVFERAAKADYIQNSYQPYLNNFKAGQDTYQAAASVAKTIPPEMINIRAIMKDSGGPATLTKDYILSMGDMPQFILSIIHDLLSYIVPRPLDAFHLFEKEEDGPVWIKELDIRVANMRSLIFELYKKDIYFVHNNTGTESGYLKEMARSPLARSVYPISNGTTEYVTYELDEKVKFNHMIFTFLFPQLADYLKNDILTANDIIIRTQTLLSKERDEQSYLDKSMGILTEAKNATVMLASGINPITVFKLARADIVGGRLAPNPLNRYFTVPSLLKQEIDSKKFKPLLNTQQLNLIIKKN